MVAVHNRGCENRRMRTCTDAIYLSAAAMASGMTSRARRPYEH